MSIFKKDREIKRMIFNIYADLAERLEHLKDEAKGFDKRLDVDTAINKTLEKFIKKAEKKIDELQRESKEKRPKLSCSPASGEPRANAPDEFPGSKPKDNSDSAD